MASSSLSQESLDRDDYDFIGGRGACRAKPIRGRCWGGQRTDSLESGDMEGPDIGPPALGSTGMSETAAECTGEHDSPTRATSRLKDKRGRPIHLHKGKTAKDKRKLREKRRSTGVVHLPSTESTGDSLDEDEKLLEARRNTAHNEVIDADNPQTPEEDRKSYGTRTRNKSPSDLEADLEDNQDYDSTVSQSETNLTMIGSLPPIPSSAPIGHSHLVKPKPSLAPITMATSLEYDEADSVRDDTNSSDALAATGNQRPVSYPSHFSEQHHKINNSSHEAPLKSSLSSRVQKKGGNGFVGVEGVRKGDEIGAGREHVRWQDGNVVHEAAVLEQNLELEKALQQERAESQKLRDALAEKEAVIADLRWEISMLHKDLEVADEQFDDVTKENQALLRALASLTTEC